jgi:hypothetical protein
MALSDQSNIPPKVRSSVVRRLFLIERMLDDMRIELGTGGAGAVPAIYAAEASLMAAAEMLDSALAQHYMNGSARL